MPKMTPGADIHIAALDNKRVVDHSNLMHAGTGTPWEDRGHIGALKAFFATCWIGMFSPRKLLHSIRRPETDSDVRGFVLGCGMLWGITAFVHSALLLWKRGDDWWVDDDYWFWIGAVGLAVLSPLIVWLMHKIATAILAKINSIELRSRAPNVLTYNIVGYCMGPSLVALLPVVGPALAIVWIIATGITACASRLKLTLGTSIINVLLTSLAVLGTVSVSLLVMRLLYSALIGYFR